MLVTNLIAKSEHILKWEEYAEHNEIFADYSLAKFDSEENSIA